TDAARPAGTWYYRVTASDAAGNTSAASDTATAVVTTAAPATVMAVGDLACASGTATTSVACRHGEVAALIAAAAPDRFIALGDLQYQEATLSQFLGAGAYNDTFGPLKPITLPALGNHEYYGGTTGYFDYFYGTGVTSGPYGPRPDGYYATSVGSWTVIVLNTECDTGGVTGGCGAGSPQYVWLQNQLTVAPTQCTLVAAHRPRWSTGSNHGSYPALSPLWDLMAANGVDVYLGAHNHVSEIFKPIGVSGAGATPSQSPTGIRSFTAGGGGVNQQPLSANTDPLLSAMEARSRAAFGPLRLTLDADSYSWQFLPISGMTFTNVGTTGAFSGTDSCH
ncbi:metallophosphoesterase family protein, partial [Cryobacterium cryoconiti]